MAVWLHRMAVCGEQRWLCGYTGWLYAVSRDGSVATQDGCMR